MVLAEKPSVARDLAAFLGARTKRQGYYEGGDYQVTWAFGHLVSLKEPDEYDPSLKKWSLTTLPFIPQTFLLKQVGDSYARQQFKTIQSLFQKADELICATDAGREGELIFRYILQLSKCQDKPFRRLWLSSLTDAAIKDAFDELKPGSDYDNLYTAARCRSESDWIVGLNATRYFTVRYGRDNGVLWSVGRVQTPVLAMIVRRDDEIRHFVPKPFWELTTVYRDAVFRYIGERFGEQAKAVDLAAQIRDQPFTVTDVKTKPEKTPPPLLYDLTTLQRDMNVRFGMSAADTLKTAQSLYETKLITYPRTDSQYLSRDMTGQVAAVMKKLESQKPNSFEGIDTSKLTSTSRIYNDKKVTDHHAIIPTGKAPGALQPASQRVYDAVALRLIAAHHGDCVKDVTTVQGSAGDTKFRARGVRVIEPGWTKLYPQKSKAKTKGKENEEDYQDQQELPTFTKGESGPHEPKIKEGQTKPPRHFTENSLLGAMETAGRLVDDETLKEALKEKGLGTPATRAAIIETLLNRRYIQRAKKNLTATDLGRYLIAVIRDPNLKSPELTGEWEAKLKKIEQGELDDKTFIGEISDYTNHLIHRSDSTPPPSPSDGAAPLGECPICGKPIIEGNASFGCSGWR
ncbi:MAG: DNA topoisomerase 3, partial [Planctomycetota bacterium]